MTPSPKILAAIGTVLVAAAFASGRLTAPKCAPSIEFDHSRDVTAEEDEKAKGVDVQQIAVQAVAAHTEKRKTTRTVKKPDGTVATTVDEIDSHDESTTSALATARASWEREATTRIEDIERTHIKQLAAARPDWSVTAIAGANVPDRERFIAGSIARRILGPFELGLFASTRGDVGAALGARW